MGYCQLVRFGKGGCALGKWLGENKGKEWRGRGLTFRVQPWIIPRLLARIDMDPPSAVLRIHFCPDMVLDIPDPADLRADSSTQHREAIRPLAAAAALGFEQGPDVGVAGEALELRAGGEGALVEFDAGAATGGFVGGGGGEAFGEGGGAAVAARGIVDEGEEGAFEPSGRKVC